MRVLVEVVTVDMASLASYSFCVLHFFLSQFLQKNANLNEINEDGRWRSKPQDCYDVDLVR